MITLIYLIINMTRATFKIGTFMFFTLPIKTIEFGINIFKMLKRI